MELGFLAKYLLLWYPALCYYWGIVSPLIFFVSSEKRKQVRKNAVILDGLFLFACAGVYGFFACMHQREH